MRKGIICAVGAYLIWGLVPIYWKLLDGIPATQLIAHRFVWSSFALFGFILLRRQSSEFLAGLRVKRAVWSYAATAALIAVNWLVYVWAVNAGFIVETSLGYFINPLVSILLGVIVLRERLRRTQWIPVCLAFAGVLYLTVTYGSLPWISLTLAFTFGLYGLVKKTAPLNSFQGLALETGLLLGPTLGYLIYAERAGTGAFLHNGATVDMLLLLAGLVTTIPLLLFAEAAKRIPLSIIGMLQYIAPTLQFLLGVFVYKEPFNRNQLIGFGMVWTALALSALESGLARRSSERSCAAGRNRK